MAWSTAYDWIEVALPLVMLPIVARTHRPYVALAWLAAILVVPITATLLCLYLGEFRLRRRRRRHEDIAELVGPAFERLRNGGESAPPPVDDRGLQALLTRVGGPSIGGWPAVSGNEVALFEDCERCLDALIRDIDAAERHVHLLFYLFAPDACGRRVGDALARAAGRGVRCRLLAGDYSSRFEAEGSLFRELVPELRRAGVETAPLRPINPLRNGLARIDLRNHRKLAVVDGRTAWIGSQNIHDPDLGLDDGIWHQLMARIEGPGALQAQAVFAHDWCLETGECLDAKDTFPEVAGRGDVTTQTLWWGPDDAQPAFVRALLALFGCARERILLCSPYFVPDDPILLGLQVASHRGVDVHVVLPRESDKWYVDAAARACFEPLLEAGVAIHRHQRGVLHSKCLSVDDAVAVVGSANIDQRSLYLDYELATVFYDAGLARRVRTIVEGYVAESERVELERWQARPRLHATADSMAALLSPLL